MILRFLLLFIAAHACFAQLTGIVSNNFVAPADWSWWVGNGSLSETVNGLTSVSNGSLVYAGSVPSPHYEVRAKYRIASSGGVMLVSPRYDQCEPACQHGLVLCGGVDESERNRRELHRHAQAVAAGRGHVDLIVFFETAIACATEFDMGFAIRDGAIVVYRPDLGVVLHWVGLPQVYPSAAATNLPGAGCRYPGE